MFSRRIVLLAVSSVAAAVSAAAAASGGQPASQPEAEASARLRAPVQSSPRRRASVEVVPAFSWRPVRGAVSYEFQLAADRAFESPVDGLGRSGSISTTNTYASISRALADGTYHWRVRAVDRRDRAGRWSRVRTIRKDWSTRPGLLSPGEGAVADYPGTPLVLRWSPVRHAYKYLVTIAADPLLATPVIGGVRDPLETSATAYALPRSLPPGRYYWAVTPLNGRRHRGARSAVGSFIWSWNTASAPSVQDLNGDGRVFDPQFSWTPVPGAAEYELEVNPSSDFAPGSKVCCTGTTTGTVHSPQKVLPNNDYHWRVRAIDIDGNAGAWNVGADFKKDFDNVAPTIPGLRMLHDGPSADLDPDPGPPVVDTPIVDWDPVPGASSYEIQVTPHESGQCNWTSRDKFDVKTATTAWTPLSPTWNGELPGGVSFPRASRDSKELVDGMSYCVRVLARTDRTAAGEEVVSDWTQLGGQGAIAFTYDAAAVADVPGTIAAEDGTYRLPTSGSVTPRMPLFTWNRVAGARSYFVVVSKDPEFTQIADVAITQVPAYAPRDTFNPWTYPDESTSYYWAVVPAKEANGGGVGTEPQENSPKPFNKRSTPPSLLSPGAGAAVTTQPTFRWTAAEGAREYRIQVAQDPSFGDPLEDVTTAATSYTSAATYPADTVLYWRVRANDELRTGLTWSATGSFRRVLPMPAAGSGNLTGGETIPVLLWSPVHGAVSYDMHVDQADGTTRDFRMRSSAFTPVIFYGTGVWRWQVRANFKSGSRVVGGPYSQPVPFTRRIGTPAGARARVRGRRALISWEPSPMAKGYRVELATTNSFRRIVEAATVDNPSYAPVFRGGNRGTRRARFWRVAVIDEGNNIGGWATGSFVPARQLIVSVSGRLRRGRRGRVVVRVTDGRGRRVRKARVSVTGAARARRRATNRRGIVRFRLRPRARGRVVFRAVKRRYRPGRATVRVRAR